MMLTKRHLLCRVRGGNSARFDGPNPAEIALENAGGDNWPPAPKNSFAGKGVVLHELNVVEVTEHLDRVRKNAELADRRWRK